MRETLRSSRTLDKEDRTGANEEAGKGTVLILYSLCAKKEETETPRS